VHLWVTRGNEPALRLYESMGFRPTGESQPLPSDPARVELAMTREL
jgi:ribosomal protein S18 acetylase RimI-like enzyme